ncbi:peripheral-type benzodiazepine receptor-associated protein 1 [Limosa lapponica baueri]|uniref:Peripheral-type benzodiazepine receptor-associated protein 1 n=1 Tax=Limosa lapponica baueri TaxID=1758121 RepID=A0A2I0U414_LIMLA|nr:peripheral-type benzodiazepine receptor-associated protein 1 [Limosa lapponica baueri]
MAGDSAGWGPVVGSCQAAAGGLLHVPGPAEKGLVPPDSTRNQLLEQKARLEYALEGLERQHGALEMKNRLLRKGSSPEGCKEAERLQQKCAKLAALTKQLKEKCRHLQETIDCLTNPPVSLTIQSTAEELGMKSLPQQRAGERRESARTLLEQEKQNEASQKVAEELQAQMAADKEGSHYVSTLRQKYEELKVQLMEMADKNTRLLEENALLRWQMHWAEKVEAENVDLKGQLMKVAEKQNSATQAISCLQTKLEDAERKLKALAERRQHLEKEGEETKPVLQRKEKQDEFLQHDQTDGKGEHQEAMQLFQAQVDENSHYVGELVDGRRGFNLSNCVKDVSGDDLENKNWNDPHYYPFSLSPILEEDVEDLDVGVGG